MFRLQPRSSHLPQLSTINSFGMAYFRITLLRSAIGLPDKYAGVLRALGLTRRMRTVYHPVSKEMAGQIFSVKELVDVQEVESKISNKTLKQLRKPDPGFYVESRSKTAKAQWN
ncbi:mitochondrial 54S ribosomal protein YmL33 [Myriangium duriaei CBS 260.36]|uniref:Large ribosomal subunit protein uL30m n=1 Tax=Myriangium duriaei CBS 260.36 TaxID=1168546 RepID=A0A9P4J6C9_9PEZI|nr:mitochondrial 54S ribosomal protein YmL33 [Myriangium duriaei CBS 260.36]